MRPAGTCRNATANQTEDLFSFYYSSALNVSKKKGMCGRVDLFCSSLIFRGKNGTFADVKTFFCSSLIFSGKNGAFADVKTFFSLPITAALCFFRKFSNAALRVNVIAPPELEHYGSMTVFRQLAEWFGASFLRRP